MRTVGLAEYPGKIDQLLSAKYAGATTGFKNKQILILIQDAYLGVNEGDEGALTVIWLKDRMANAPDGAIPVDP
jgi:hypothetical protein